MNLGRNKKPNLMVPAVIITVLAGICAEATAEPNLVSWWRFDEGAGNTAYDSVGENDGTLVNSPVWMSGQVAGALSFDGIDDYVLVPDSPSLRVTGELSLSVYIHLTSLGDQGIVAKSGLTAVSDGDYYLSFSCGAASDSQLVFGINGNCGGDNFAVSGPVIETGRWQHIVGTYNYGEMKIYVDGELEGTKFSPDSIPATTKDLIIGAYASTEWTLDGIIEDVRIYNRALSAEEIQQLYQEQFRIIEVPMKLTPQMLNCESHGNWLKAHFIMPEDIYPEDIDVNTPALAYPPGIESEFIEVFDNGSGSIDVQIYFDRESFCRVLSGSEEGSLEVTITGSLTDGGKFNGTDTIRVITHSLTLRNVHNNRIYLCDLNYNPLGPSTTSSSITPEDLPDEPLLFTAYVSVPGYGNHMFTAANGGSGYMPVGQTLDVLYEAARHRYLRSDAILQRALAHGFVFPADLIDQLNTAEMYLRQAAESIPGSSQQAYNAIDSLQFSCPAAERLVVEHARQIILQQGGLREEQSVSTFALYGYREGQPWKEAMDAAFNTGVANWHWQDVVRRNGTFNWKWWDGTVSPPQYLHSDDTVNMLYQELGKDVRGHCILWLLGHPNWPSWLRYTYANVTTQVVNFAEAVVTRYPEIDVWNIANEVTNSPYCVWTPAQMVEMVRAVSNKVAQCNPDAQRGINSVLLRGVDAANNFYHDPAVLCPYDFYEMLNDAGVDYEYIGMQLYYHSNTRDLFEVDQVLETYSRLGKRIRICESAAPSNSSQNTWYIWYRNWDPELQADWLEGMFTLCLSKDYVDEWNWWDMADYPGSFIPTSGLLDGNYNPKPAYFRLQQLMNFWTEPDSSEVATTPQPLTLETVWDLASDWSDTNNPSKTWSYGGDLTGLWNTMFDLLDTHQSEWAPLEVGPGQPAWADTVDGAPAWYRSIGNGWWDCPAGRVACHTPTTVRWISPINGKIHINGGLWLRNSNRPQYWQLRHNDALVSGGLLEYGPTSAVPLSYTTGSGGSKALIRMVKPGDVIELYLTKAASDYDFVGVDLTISKQKRKAALGALQGLIERKGRQPIECVREHDRGGRRPH